VGTANWRGDGVVKLHGVDASATAAFALGDSLRLYPMEGWATVPADAPAAAVTISAKETPTLGARCDWTYGPAAGAEPETAATDRALVVVKDATLTIDTEDPETGVGHTITFADPIFAEGDVVKAGAGTLAFATSETLIKGSFRLTGGEIALSGGLADAAKSAWVPVVAASSFEGLDAAMSPLYRRRVVAREDGLFQLEVREAVGAVLILR